MTSSDGSERRDGVAFGRARDRGGARHVRVGPHLGGGADHGTRRTVRAISNTGLCLEDIQGTLAQALDTTGARVIFTDLPAGSCTMAVRRMIRERPGVLLVTGVNLSLLLDFAMQNVDDPAQAVQAALDRGRAAMVMHGAAVAGA